jgi:hypothetical protein
MEVTVSSPYESADLLMKLYDLRREATMREARTWFFMEFNPKSVDDLVGALMGPHSGHFRMVTSYWDMAASFVSNDAIDEKMFNEVNGEQVGVFAKIEPFLAEYRVKMNIPTYLSNLEQVVLRKPGAREMLAAYRERFGRAVSAGR